MTDSAEVTGPATDGGAAESVRRVRALAGDLVARPLDEPAAERLAAALSDLPVEDRDALRSLARGRGGIADRSYARLTDSGRDRDYSNTPSQGPDPYRHLERQQGAHRR